MTLDREQIKQAYIEQLGLVRDPFDEATDEFFFVGGQRRFLVQQAVHALYFAGGLVLISGAEGAGKTRVVDEVCRELAELADVCRLDASVLMDMNAIRAQFADELGLSVDVSSDDSLLAALNELMPETGDPLPVLLAIDDAHQLAVPVLVACQDLVRASAGRIRLLLAGAPELLTAWSQTGRTDGDQLDVLALDAQETLDYLATSLQAAGYRGDNPLNEAQQDELFRKSRGNIGAIHALAPELLCRAVTGDPASTRTRGLPWQHIAIVAGLLVVVGALLFFFRREGGGEPAPMPVQDQAADGRQSVPLAMPKLEAPASASVEPQQQPTNPEPAAESMQPAASTTPIALPAPAPSAQPAPASPAKSVAVPSKPAAISKPTVAQAPVEKPPVAKPAATMVAPKPVAVAAADKPTRVSGRGDEVGKGLAAMPKDQFVIQLMAATSRPKLNDFLERSGKGVKVYTYETRRDGKPWYVAVTGPYPSKDAARSAISGLPKPLRDQSPWLRSVASIQSDLKNK